MDVSDRRDIRDETVPAPIRCGHCLDVIGVYEPLIVCDDGVARETSRAVEPGLPRTGADYYHRRCHAAGAREQAHRRSGSPPPAG